MAKPFQVKFSIIVGLTEISIIVIICRRWQRNVGKDGRLGHRGPNFLWDLGLEDSNWEPVFGWLYAGPLSVHVEKDDKKQRRRFYPRGSLPISFVKYSMDR